MNLRATPCAIGIAALALLSMLSACNRVQGDSTTTAPIRGLPSEDMIAAVPLGEVAGAPDGSVAALSIANPYGDNPQAIQEGKQLYIKMNCAGCHAYNGKGNMGPDLTDTYWRYGGLPIQIYKSIFEGRPKGMPAWGTALPPDDIWKLVAYIQSLGGSMSVSDYEHARQGDQPGEQIAYALQTEAQPESKPSPVVSPPVSSAQPPAKSAIAPAMTSEAQRAPPTSTKLKSPSPTPNAGEPHS